MAWLCGLLGASQDEVAGVMTADLPTPDEVPADWKVVRDE